MPKRCQVMCRKQLTVEDLVPFDMNSLACQVAHMYWLLANVRKLYLQWRFNFDEIVFSPRMTHPPTSSCYSWNMMMRPRDRTIALLCELLQPFSVSYNRMLLRVIPIFLGNQSVFQCLFSDLNQTNKKLGQEISEEKKFSPWIGILRCNNKFQCILIFTK